MVVRSTLLGVLALLCLGLSCADEVLTVDGGNFEEVVTSNPRLVVEFYAPWCGHCKKLAPEYEKAAGLLLQKNPKVVLAKCDATDDKNKALAERYGIKGFPTLKIFNGTIESPKDYSGPREAKGIVEYVMKIFGPACTPVTDPKSYDALMEHDLIALGVFPVEDSKELKVFLDVAKDLKDEMEFGHTSKAELVAKCGDVKCEAATVMLFVPGENIFEVFTGEFEQEPLTNWLEETSKPEMPILSSTPRMQKVLAKIFASKKTRLLVFAEEGCSEADELKQAIIKAAKGENNVHIIYGETANNEGALSYFGVKTEDVPAFVAHDPVKDLKYVKPSAKASELAEFVEQLKAGNLEPNIKSEEPPKDNDGPVKIVTGKTYKEIVQESGKKVFLEFYAPWCGHCKKLAPVYEELGKRFKGNDNVIIAKMDATKNDVPDPKIKVTGYPTLMFFDGEGGDVKEYEGQRNLEALVAYINKNAPEEDVYEDADEIDEADETEDVKTEL